MTAISLSAEETARRLPWRALVDEIKSLLLDTSVSVPERIVMPTTRGAVLFVMPAHDRRLAMAKLITLTPANARTSIPAIQGDVVVFDVTTGERRLVLDGPTVTARRTAAVSALAARLLAPDLGGPMLIVGAGVQACAHLEVFSEVLGVRDFRIVSRHAASAERLARHGRGLGLAATAVNDADRAAVECPLVATCTPAHEIVLRVVPHADGFVAAIGAFAPDMAEIAAPVCRAIARQGRIVLDTGEAVREAGDLLQAGIAVDSLPTLCQVVQERSALRPGPVLFKNCGWAGWDLAAARLAASIAA